MLKVDQIPDVCAQEAYRVWFKQGATWKDVVAAALNAWPGMGTVATEDHAGVWRQIILPLPQEESGDE